ncbi:MULTISPECIES: helix-turn-helix domain-containing protein [Anaerotignum]|uniref:helix-turn-helix domain-containing protein n=1 Tax=Anaerotignum TaxID=2039240 RepID=UPI0021097A81|nr:MULTISPECIES: helix-turn-helix transcriptional regulator [Anaerotignum]MCQ4935188.1 helix-turn-helix domain-containing protein [Anaerotignum propionicum]
MNVGQRIKECRIRRGLTVDELAEKLKKNRATVYRYEKGDIENLPITILEPIAEALGTSPAFLMGWTENSTPLTEKKNVHEVGEIREVFHPTAHELEVLKAYRNQPNMQPAVDRILGVTSRNNVRLDGKVAARGFKETTVSKRIDKTPETIKYLLDNASEEVDF